MDFPNFDFKFPQAWDIVAAAMRGDEQAMKDAFSCESTGVAMQVMLDLTLYCVKEIEAQRQELRALKQSLK